MVGADDVWVIEPSPAERARTLLETSRGGVLASVASDFQPYAAPIPFLPDGKGDVITVLTNINRHVVHALHEPRASLSVGDRLTIVGGLEPVPGFVQYVLEHRYVAAHPESVDKVIALDCSWLRLVPTRVSFDDIWLDLEDWRNAEPDPLRDDMADVIVELNAIADEVLALTKARAGRPLASSAAPVGVDRYGIDVAVTEPVGRSLTRIAFPEPVACADDAFRALIFMVRALPEQ
jgi:heme iron utilization protein